MFPYHYQHCSICASTPSSLFGDFCALSFPSNSCVGVGAPQTSGVCLCVRSDGASSVWACVLARRRVSPLRGRSNTFAHIQVQAVGGGGGVHSVFIRSISFVAAAGKLEKLKNTKRDFTLSAEVADSRRSSRSPSKFSLIAHSRIIFPPPLIPV